MTQTPKGITTVRIWRVDGERIEVTNDASAAKLERQHGKPHYVAFKAQIRVKGRRSKSQSFASLKDAKDWLDKQHKAADAGEVAYDPRAMRRITIQGLLRTHEEARSKRNLGYMDSDRHRINALVRRIGHVSLLEADNPHFWSRYCDRRREEVSDDTIARELNLIQGAWEAARTFDRLPLPVGDNNPIRLGRTQAQLTLKPSRNRRLNAQEEARIITAATHYGRTERSRGVYMHVIVLLIETAISRADLVRIHWSDVDLENMEMTVPARRKGRRREKSADERHLALSQHAVDALKAMQDQLRITEADKRKAKAKGLPEPPDLIVGTLKPASISQAFSRIAATAEVEDLTLHDLRHEGASRFFARGLSAMEVSIYTGHRTLQMLKRYTHPSVDELRRRLEAADTRHRTPSPDANCDTSAPQGPKDDDKSLT